MPDESVVERAEMLLRVGRPAEARQLLASTPDLASNAAAMLVLADSLRGLGQHEDALAAADSVIALAPQWEEGYLSRAAILIDRRQYMEALDACGVALQLAPDSIRAHGTCAGILLDLDKFDEAMWHANRVVSLAPNHEFGWLLQGEILLRSERSVEAITSANAALSIQPNSTDAKFLLGLAHYTSNQPGGATTGREHMIDALRQDPTSQHIADFLKRMAMPRRLQFPVWAAVLVALAGGAGFLLLAWAGACVHRWFSTPKDIRQLVWADQGARRRIIAGLGVSALVGIFFFAVMIAVIVEQLGT